MNTSNVDNDLECAFFVLLLNIHYLGLETIFANCILNAIDTIIITDVLIEALAACSGLSAVLHSNDSLFLCENSILRFVSKCVRVQLKIHQTLCAGNY